MKVDVYDIMGKKTGTADLPKQFEEDYDFDLVKRAVLVIRANNRQGYGAMPRAGKNYSAKLSRRRRDYKGAYGKRLSRIPRKTIWRRGTQFAWVGALAPGTVGGRKAHPPKSSRVWVLEINSRERRKAIRSALSGVLKNARMVVVENNFENLSKTKDVKNVLKVLMFNVDGVKRRGAGRGKSRGREVRYKKNALIVTSKRCSLFNAVSNLAGYTAVDVRSVNAEVLTLGVNKPRDCIFTEGALDLLGKEDLFFDKK